MNGTFNLGIIAAAVRQLISTPIYGSGWSTTDRVVQTNSSFTYSLSNAKLTIGTTVVAGASNGTNRAVVSSSTGKHYFEVLIGGSPASTDIAIGVMGPGAIPASGSWKDCTDQVCIRPNGQVFRNGLSLVSTGSGYAGGDIIGVAVDLTAGTVAFYINNVLRETATLSATTAYPTFWLEDKSFAPSATLKTAAGALTYTPPAGFQAWENSTGSYRYWRLTITRWAEANVAGTSGETRVAELQFFDMAGREWPQVAMTSNTSPSPYVASVSGSSSGTAAEAFNKLFGDANRWISNTGAGPHWLQFDAGSSVPFAAMKLAPDGAASIGYYPVDFNVKASNTGAFTGEEVTVFDVTNVTTGWANNTGREFKFALPAGVFAYTGATQSYVVPAGVTSITAALWGGAGGTSFEVTTPQRLGGPGGYTIGTLAVTPGETLTVDVGGGGTGSSSIRISGAGGGGSAILRGSTPLLVAGGGGGSGTRGSGGSGGGTTGQDGVEAVGPADDAGGGGTQSAAGAAGLGGRGNGNAGSGIDGGNGGANAGGGTAGGWGYGIGGIGGNVPADAGGGGGGGGDFGGGGGGWDANGDPGGGGSGYVGSATSASTAQGTGSTPAGNTAINYAPGVATPGGVGQTGGNGFVVITPV